MKNKEELYKQFPDILTIDELIEALGVGRNTAYKIIRNKLIYSKKIGKQYLIPKISVIEYIYNEKIEKNEMLKEYKQLLCVNDIIKILRRTSRNTVYQLIKEGKIFSVKIADSYKVPKDALIDYIFNFAWTLKEFVILW